MSINNFDMEKKKKKQPNNNSDYSNSKTNSFYMS